MARRLQSGRVNNVPTEEEEQIAFVQWCHMKGIITEHASNEIGGSLGAMKAKAIKNKKMGTTAGFPDLLLAIPVYGCDDHVDSYQLAVVEMKRQKGSTTSPAQREWLAIFEKAGIPGEVCRGCGEAIKFVSGIMEEISNEQGLDF